MVSEIAKHNLSLNPGEQLLHQLVGNHVDESSIEVVDVNSAAKSKDRGWNVFSPDSVIFLTSLRLILFTKFPGGMIEIDFNRIRKVSRCNTYKWGFFSLGMLLSFFPGIWLALVFIAGGGLPFKDPQVLQHSGPFLIPALLLFFIGVFICIKSKVPCLGVITGTGRYKSKMLDKALKYCYLIPYANFGGKERVSELKGKIEEIITSRFTNK